MKTKHVFLAPDVDAAASAVGAFEGANYQATGYYRPQLQCTMFTRSERFCRVCAEAIGEVIDLFFNIAGLLINSLKQLIHFLQGLIDFIDFFTCFSIRKSGVIFINHATVFSN